MNQSPTSAAGNSRYELHFPCLTDSNRGYAFPCDAEGRVAMDELCDRGRNNYFYARAVVGRKVSNPRVRTITRPHPPP
jgi:hypothetical protein